jgi:hypothetical protein
MIKFQFNSYVKDVAETKGQTFIEGCLISEGKSENGNWYTFESLRTIAKSAISKPLYYGVDERNRHRQGEPIGRIVKTWFAKRFGRVYFKALITNKKIAESVKRGFGVSIGGVANARNLIDSFGRIAQKILSLTIEHVQLLRPEIHRGVKEATVSKVVNETMTFRSYGNNKILDSEEIFWICLALEKTGDLE